MPGCRRGSSANSNAPAASDPAVTGLAPSPDIRGRAVPAATAIPLAQAEFDRRLDALGPFEDAPELVVAVSGGADSMALLLYADRWARARGGFARVITINHGLRPESLDEAIQVEAWCDARGIKQLTLTWRGEKPKSGIQAAARAARYRLMTHYCRFERIAHLLLGHNAGDQAETFLHRMGRGSGVDGLAAMPGVAVRDGVRLLRPLLDVPRDRLTAFLQAENQSWIEDPGNADTRYGRIALRRKLPDLARAGIGPDPLRAATRAFGALRADADTRRAALAAETVAVFPEGYAEIDAGRLRAAAPDAVRELLSALLHCIGGRNFAPRRARLDRLVAAVCVGGPDRPRTLGGCILAPGGGRLRVWREPKAIRDVRIYEGWRTTTVIRRFLWDGRFKIDIHIGLAGLNVQTGGFRVAPLGEEGWQSIADAVDPAFGDAIPGPVRFALPALYLGGGVAEVPHLGYRRVADDMDIDISAQFSPPAILAAAPFRVA